MEPKIKFNDDGTVEVSGPASFMLDEYLLSITSDPNVDVETNGETITLIVKPAAEEEED